MPRYRYEAQNDAGDASRGVLTTTSAAAATAQLESRGLRVRSVSLDHRQLGEAEAPLIAAVDRLMESRAELAEPLTAYAEEFATGRRRRELLVGAKLLTAGDRDDVLAAAGDDPAAWSALLAATAENDGNQSLFARFVERETTASEVRRRHSLALAYPLFLVTLSLAVVWAFSVVVMPTFSAIFRDFGLELPGFTSLVLATGCFLASGGALLLLGLMLLSVVLWTTYPRWAPRRLRRILGRFIGLRRVNRSLSSARLANHLANLLEAGTPIPAGITLLDGDGVNDTHAASRPPSAAIAYAASSDLRPATRMRLLRTFAVNSNEAAAEVEDYTLGMAGPLSVFALGCIVALCMVALFLPLVKLIGGLS